MERIPLRYLALLVVAALALVIGLASVAFGGSSSGGSSTKQVKKIVAQQIQKLAPGLSVASATKAGSADSADNADKVGGAKVCSGTVTIQNNGTQTLCSAGSISINAVCQSSGGGTQARIDPDTTGDAWAFGQRVDYPVTDSQIVELSMSDGLTFAEGLDSNSSLGVTDGGGFWASIGAADGSSISGTFGVRANYAGASQGTCVYSMGAIAR